MDARVACHSNCVWRNIIGFKTAGVKRVVGAKAAGGGRRVLDVVTGFKGAEEVQRRACRVCCIGEDASDGPKRQLFFVVGELVGRGNASTYCLAHA